MKIRKSVKAKVYAQAAAEVVRFLNRFSSAWERLRHRDPDFPGSSPMQTVYRIRGKVACPRCESGVGMDCLAPSGRRVRKMHDERVLLGLRSAHFEAPR